jgi:exodeoxyribonuclease VIII
MNFPGTGIYEMTAEEYFSIDAASNSGLKLIAQSPLHFMDSKINPKAPTEAMIFGTAVHSAILEPELFAESIVVLPYDRPNRPSSRQINAKKPSAETLAAIDWWADFDRVNAGKSVIDTKTYAKVLAVRSAVMNNPDAAAILNDGDAEQAVFWIDEDTGVECKARMDFIGSCIADVKTTNDASANEFRRTIGSYRYHVQAAFYLDGLFAADNSIPHNTAFKFIAVEKEPPFAVAVYWLGRESTELGRRIYKRDLNAYAMCKALNSWPGYPAGGQEIDLNRWEFTKGEQE